MNQSNPFKSPDDQRGKAGSNAISGQFSFNSEGDRFQARGNSDQVRKGKWTAEEERYANKVIEYFNAGTLKLDEADRGITLRAYLSHKLGCDPMRITKKYTGAACLGKRVYHAFLQKGKAEDVDLAEKELLSLENEFKVKLAQMGGRRRTSSDGYASAPTSITTPGIEALFQNNQYSEQWTHVGNSPTYSYGLTPFHPSYAASMISRPVPMLDLESGQHRAPDNSPADTPTAAAGSGVKAEGRGPVATNGSAYRGMFPVFSDPTPLLGASSHFFNTSAATQHGLRDRTDESDAKRLRVEHEPHDTEAASSLLGFFTHLERHSSQEDMLHFVEGVQKTATAAATVASTRSPPKPVSSSFAPASITTAASTSAAYVLTSSPTPSRSP